jgi:hypothetical protein
MVMQMSAFGFAKLVVKAIAPHEAHREFENIHVA